MEELQELREEVELLTKKVELLESKENKRKAFSYLKILFKIILIGVCIYGVYWGYNYVVNELPNVIVDKVKDVGISKIFS